MTPADVDLAIAWAVLTAALAIVIGLLALLAFALIATGDEHDAD